MYGMHVFAMHGRLHEMFRVHVLEVHSAYVHVPYGLHGLQWSDGRQADLEVAGGRFAEIEGATAARAEAS